MTLIGNQSLKDNFVCQLLNGNLSGTNRPPPPTNPIGPEHERLSGRVAWQAPLESLQAHVEHSVTRLSKGPWCFWKLAGYRERVPNLLLPGLLADDQVLLEAVEVAQQEVSSQHGANIAEIVVEADDIQALIGLEVVSLLRQES
jgi:hypothetical protein